MHRKESHEVTQVSHRARRDPAGAGAALAVAGSASAANFGLGGRPTYYIGGGFMW